MLRGIQLDNAARIVASCAGLLGRRQRLAVDDVPASPNCAVGPSSTHAVHRPCRQNAALDQALVSYQTEYSHCEAAVDLVDGTWSIVKTGNCGYE